MQGLTQAQLATAAHVSASMVAKVEAGHVSGSTNWVGAVARALGVDASRLHGLEDSPDQLHRVVPTIRRALAAVDLADEDLEPEPLDRLRREVLRVGEWRRATKYSKISAVLPDLVERLLVSARVEGEPAYALLAYTYRAGNTLAHKLGYADLSLTAMDRMTWAAERSGDPLLVATTYYLRAASLGRIGADKQATRLLNRAMAQVEPLIKGDQTAAAVYSRLHTYLGTTAAIAADPATSKMHLDEAARVVAGTKDRLVYESVIGPTSVEIFRVAAAVDLGNPHPAITIAENMHFEPGMANERQASYWLDMARAHLLNNKVDLAVDALCEARSIAPEHFLASPLAKSTIETAAQRQRRTSDSLRILAHSVGLTAK